MTSARPAARPCLMWAAVLFLLAQSAAVAENIDPGNDGSRYAWSENLGWLDARPGGPGGPGVQVSGTGLIGWIWSENAGWISLSCANTFSCGTQAYGVTNDGCGTLSGHAWSENTGWIDFAPAACASDPTCGVHINPLTGIFTGRAWSENAGWVTFSAVSPVAYRVATSWRGSGAVPAGSPNLTVATAGGNGLLLSWTALPGATTYDIVQGLLSYLRSSSGNYQSATMTCSANDRAATSLTIGGTPGVGDGFWFLVRGVSCGGAGTYDSGAASQVGSRDAEIAASGKDCP